MTADNTATEAVPAQVGRTYSVTRAEQETVIRWDLAERVVHVWSAAPAVWRKMARLGLAPSRTAMSYGTVAGHWWTIPLDRFRWGLKAKGRPGNLANLTKHRKGLPEVSQKSSVGSQGPG